MDEHEHTSDWPRDLREPTAGPYWRHLAWATPSVLLGLGAGIAAAAVLGILDARPTWRPEDSNALACALLAAALAARVAWVGRCRAGELMPRLVVLALAAAASLVALLLTAGPDWLGRPLEDAAAALLAATFALLPRLTRPPEVPSRRSAALVLLGPAFGLASALLVAATLNTAVSSHDPAVPARLEEIRETAAAELCRRIEAAWRADLAPLVRGLEAPRLGELEVLARELSATSPDTDLTGEACDGARSALLEALRATPSPTRLATPTFRHDPRPASAGELTAEVVRDTGPACRLQGALALSAHGLTGGLERDLAQRVAALGSGWLEGFLASCLGGQASAPAARLAAPPAFDSGRPDRWLAMPLEEALNRVAGHPACAARDLLIDDLRRFRALDCVILGADGTGHLEIVAELGVVYASEERGRGEDEPPPLSPSTTPAALRLLLATGGSTDFHTEALDALESFTDALDGARLDPAPSQDPTDSAAWRFGLRVSGTSLEGSISRRVLPSGSDAVLFVLRRAGGAA